MAIIEIAKIKVRRGQENVTGIPQLDSGEFGWAVDTQKLYIGNGDIAEGAPEVGNTELLTEHSIVNIFQYPLYIYKGNSPSSPVTTGPSGSGDTIRTIQQKLDDEVSVKDFGAIGNGVADDTPAIQQAINQIFLNSDKSDSRSRRKLKIPAGTYNVTATIYVPPYANIIGDGPDKTVLKVTAQSTALMQFVDGTSTPGTYVSFVPGVTNILSNSSPRNILIDGLSFEYSSSLNITNTLPLLRADCVTDSEIKNCKFKGIYNATTSSNSNYTGIDIRGQGVITSKNLKIENSIFDSIYYGIQSNYDIEDILVNKNKFLTLYRGVVYSESLVLGNNTGAFRSKITQNRFDNIEREAFYVGANNNSRNTEHVTSQNSFNNVGNNLNGDLSQTTSIINFGTSGNVSRDDNFSRFVNYNSTSTSTVFYQTVKGHTYLTEAYVYTGTLSVAVSPTTLVKIPYAGNDQKIKVNYIIDKSAFGISRKGDLLVSVSLGTTSTITDSFVYFGASDGGVEFSTALTTISNVVSINYTNSTVGKIEYQISQLQ